MEMWLKIDAVGSLEVFVLHCQSSRTYFQGEGDMQRGKCIPVLCNELVLGTGCMDHVLTWALVIEWSAARLARFIKRETRREAGWVPEPV